MSSKNQTRHEQLVNAGWNYDAASDMYVSPGSPDDGTAKRFDLTAAWLEFQAHQLDSANQLGTPPRGTRAPDPRHKEPE
jgi:hypothetical protein